jgi:hypothetical protein
LAQAGRFLNFNFDLGQGALSSGAASEIEGLKEMIYGKHDTHFPTYNSKC